MKKKDKGPYKYEHDVEGYSVNKGVEDYSPWMLYSRVSDCVEKYERHYGESPTPEIVSDILDIPVSIVSKVMESFETTRPKSR